MLFGVAFLAVGILGFVPGITTSFDQLGFAGKDSDAELLALLFVDQNDSANFVPMNNADTWLHGVLSLALLGAYALTSGERRTARSAERADRPGARAA